MCDVSMTAEQKRQKNEKIRYQSREIVVFFTRKVKVFKSANSGILPD